MIDSVRKQKKRKQDRNGLIGIATIFILGISGYFLYQQFNVPLDKDTFCPLNGSPKAVTAIIFDKSEQYNEDQVSDIRASFKFWLAGDKSPLKNDPIELSFFEEGNLIQLYVTDEATLRESKGLTPKEQLCVPKDFKDAKGWIDNPALLERSYQRFANTFIESINELLVESEGKSPIMETFLRLSNSSSFLEFPEVPHNIFIVSDMLQHSDLYSHYRSAKGEGLEWENFERKMRGTPFTRINLKNVNYQVFQALRKKDFDRNLNDQKVIIFWDKFFNNANAKPAGWSLIDG
jgi:hypothetical protein